MHLFWFLPYALIKSLFLVRQVDLIYLCDSLLAPLGLIIGILSGRPVVATAHGLDIIYDKWFYQIIFIGALRRLDRVIAVSESTRRECLKRRISADKCVVIPNGVTAPTNNSKYNLNEILGVDIGDKKLLLTVGRLVKRKGVIWFIENVLPQLENVIYVVVGQGSEEKKIRRILVNKKIKNKVILLTTISDERLEILYKKSDIFIMPNIKVPGDREGFGLVALEAAIHGLPVVASRLEGIKEAIIDGQNGKLVKTEDATGFIAVITSWLNSDERRQRFGQQARIYTSANYSWDKITQRYLQEIEKI